LDVLKLGVLNLAMELARVLEYGRHRRQDGRGWSQLWSG
jgi:hypothetical protein